MESNPIPGIDGKFCVRRLFIEIIWIDPIVAMNEYYKLKVLRLAKVINAAVRTFARAIVNTMSKIPVNTQICSTTQSTRKSHVRAN